MGVAWMGRMPVERWPKKESDTRLCATHSKPETQEQWAPTVAVAARERPQQDARPKPKPIPPIGVAGDQSTIGSEALTKPYL